MNVTYFVMHAKEKALTHFNYYDYYHHVSSSSSSSSS